MDKKAKDILFKTYWNSKGWINLFGTDKDRHINEADFAYAKEKGLMFDPLTISHDQCIEKIKEVAQKISQDRVAQAFLSSLSTRRLEWRSALASWFVAQQLPRHEYTPMPAKGMAYRCDICGGSKENKDMDLSVLNFERMKWGGVRIGQIIYTLFDLERFVLEDITAPVKADIDIFRSILRTVESCQPGDYPGVLRDKLASALKTSRNERMQLMEIMACVGILQPASCNRPRRGRNDWHFVEYWRGEDKYSKTAVEKYFGKYLNQTSPEMSCPSTPTSAA